MKKRTILFLLILMTLLTACKTEIELIKTTSEDFTSYENENIRIEIHKDVEDEEEIYQDILEIIERINEFSPIGDIKVKISEKYSMPDLVRKKTLRTNGKYLEEEEAKKDLIRISYDLYDNWTVEGIYGKIFPEVREEVDFSKYYGENDFSLFSVRFFQPFASEEEIRNLKAASLSLVEDLLKRGQKTKLLEGKIGVSDMETWAETKKIGLDYLRERESLLDIEAIKKEEKLVLNTRSEVNGFIMEIPHGSRLDEAYDSGEKIEEMILKFNRDIEAINRGIERDAPNFYKDYGHVINNRPKLRYTLDNSINYGGLYLIGKATIILKNMHAHPHEYAHFLFHDPFMKNNIIINKPDWLNEGIVEYLNVVYSEAYAEIIREGLNDLLNFDQEALIDDEDLNIDLEILESFKIILENNIGTSDIEGSIKDKDKRLIFSHVYELVQYKMSRDINPPKVSGKDLNGKTSSDLMKQNNDLGLSGNYSFMNYLIEEYGLDKILYLSLENFMHLTYKEVFDKTYVELKNDWLDYLRDNIRDIDLLF